MDKVGMMCLLMKKHTTHHPWSYLSTENKPDSIKPLNSIQEIQRQGNILNNIERMQSAKSKLYKTLQDKPPIFLNK